MPRLRLQIGDQQPTGAELREGFATLASDKEFMRVMEAMLNLINSGHLGFWLSPQLMRRLKAFAAHQQGESSQSAEQKNDTLFLSWLQQAGSMEPHIDWKVESLPNNGGIYRMLLQGGKDEGVHDH